MLMTRIGVLRLSASLNRWGKLSLPFVSMEACDIPRNKLSQLFSILGHVATFSQKIPLNDTFKW